MAAQFQRLVCLEKNQPSPTIISALCLALRIRLGYISNAHQDPDFLNNSSHFHHSLTHHATTISVNGHSLLLCSLYKNLSNINMFASTVVVVVYDHIIPCFITVSAMERSDIWNWLFIICGQVRYLIFKNITHICQGIQFLSGGSSIFCVGLEMKKENTMPNLLFSGNSFFFLAFILPQQVLIL